MPFINYICSMSKDRRNFYLKKYEVYANALTRIKGDEKNWINVILLIYAAIFTFALSYKPDKEIYRCGFPCSIENTYLWTTFLISLFWIYHAITLRVQYYKTIYKLNKLEFKLKDQSSVKRTIKWFKNTKPLQSKFVEVLLATGLFFVSNLFMYSKGDCNCCNYELNIVLAIGMFIISVLIDLFRVGTLNRRKSRN